MDASTFADKFLHLVDTLAWPAVALLLGWPARRHLPTVGQWFGDLLKNRGFSANTPLGSVSVEAPTLSPEGQVSADANAAESAALAAPPEVAQNLRAIADELQEARQTFEQARIRMENTRSDAERRLEEQPRTDVMARRIAAYAAELINENPVEFATPFVLVGSPKRAWHAQGDVALVALAFFKGEKQTIGWRFRNATYEQWVRAAALLSSEYGIETNQPPFTREDLAILRRPKAGTMWRGPARLD